MEAKVYLEEEFFEALDNFSTQTSIGVIDSKSENKNQLINILEDSRITSPVKTKVIVNLHKKLSQNYSPNNWKDFCLFRAFRNNKLIQSEIDLTSSNSIFLLKELEKDIDAINISNNIIAIGKEYKFIYPVSPKSFASRIVDRNMNGIECIKHRCRNIVLIDPYMFEDQPNFEPKIPNLILFLDQLYQNNSNVECYLSIITNKMDNDALFERKIKEIKTGLSSIKLDISVYAHQKPHFNNNRHIITDYSIIDYQHLFDRDDASISVNYLYDNNVSENFLRAKYLKDKIIKYYKEDPKKVGLITLKFGDILQNNLLK